MKLTKNKKGGETFQLVMTVIALIFLVWGIIVMYQVFFPTKEVTKQMTTCGGIAQNLGNGFCKIDCDASFEKNFGKLGCPKEGDTQLTCCISEFSINTDNYGGNAQYNFVISGISMKDNSNCKKESSNNKYSCNKGTNIEINTKIYNKGSKEISVISYPIVYLSNVQQKINKGSAQTIQPSKSSTEYSNLTFKFTLSETGDYVIYPAAICEMAECKKTDQRNEGIYRLDKKYELWIVSK